MEGGILNDRRERTSASAKRENGVRNDELTEIEISARIIPNL